MPETKRKLFDDPKCRLYLVEADPEESHLPWRTGCDGCSEGIPQTELLIEYNDEEYFPTFCCRCVERMAEAMGLKPGLSVTWTIPIEPGDEGSIGLDALFKAMGLKPPREG